jgi:hypothetical protein
VAGKRAFDTATRFSRGLACGEQPLVVGAGLGVVADARQRDDQLSWRSPPRLSRWRRCLPLEASTGLVPASAAKDASLVIRLGVGFRNSVSLRGSVGS